jgi:hypothetical protein
MKKSSIIDSPRDLASGEIDSFGIEPFEKGLTKFIKNTNTPITIALQGEWGSGKTSLMNSLKENLCSQMDSNLHPIWLNTWEYALMKDAEATLLDIITGLIKKITVVAKTSDSDTKRILNKVWAIGKTTMKFVAKTGANKAIEGSSELIDELLSAEGEKSITEIRQDLENIIAQCVAKDSKEGFIFFIDDLDRIDPPVAVNLLELLKNIFTLKNCIFILAIDYDVVIKGLEPKFGKLTDLNEREFRSFFDKIIQVPFSMPVNNYKIDTFLSDGLFSTNYLNAEQVKNVKLIGKFSEICNLTVGTNPRALKRLLNSLSLISFINAAKDPSEDKEHLEEEIELIVNFALVSIQIAYPPVYRLLTMFPGYDSWSETTALQMNLKELDQYSIEKLNQSEEFDEEWEKVLFRLCENDPYLKRKALSISRLLNSIKTQINNSSGDGVEDVVGGIVSLSSVTNLEAFDKPIADYHRGNFLKHIRQLLVPKLKEKLPEIGKLIQVQGRRVQTNAYIKFTQNDWGQFIKLFSHPFEGKIKLLITSAKWMFAANSKSIQDCASEVGLLDDFNELEKGYNAIINAYPGFLASKFSQYITVKENNFHFELYNYVVFPNIEDFYKPGNLDKISGLIGDIYPFLIKIDEFSEKVKSKRTINN